MQLSLSDRLAFVKQSVGLLLGGSVQPNTILGMVLGNTNNPPRRRGSDFLKAYSESPWLRAVTHKVAFACASVPFNLYTGTPPNRLKPISDYNHPMLRMVRDGIPGVMSGLSVRMLTHIFLDLIGEAFWALDRTNAVGAHSMAWPVPPHWVLDTPGPHRDTFLVQVPGGAQAEFPPELMLWFKDPDPLNPYLRGTSIASSLADELGSDENAAKFINRFFHNNARPSLIVSADGLSKESVNRVEEEWNRKNQGVWNAFRTYFLNRKVDVQVIETNLQHLQFIELRRFERDMILQVYGFPPEIFGIMENSTRAGIEAADYLMAKGSVVPRLGLFDGTVQNSLVPLYDPSLFFRHDNPIPEDREKQTKMALDPNSGALVMIDERRAALGLDPLPNGQGQYFLVPLNYIAVKNPSEASLDTAPPDVPEELPEQASPKKGTKAVEDSVARVLFDVEIASTRLLGRVRPVLRLVLQEMGTSSLRELGVTDPFNLTSKNVLKYLDKQAASKMADVAKTTQSRLRAALVEGLEAKENLAQLANRVSEVFDDAKGYRSVAIAHTETGRAANFANVESYEQSGVVEEKVWLSTRDEKTRDSHRDADGQSVPLDEKFEVGDDELEYPLDPAADAEEVINCRCTTIASLKDGKMLQVTDGQKDATWKAFDRTVRGYERRVRVELVKAFQSIENDVMGRINFLKEE